MSNSNIHPSMQSFLWFAPKRAIEGEHRCYVCNALDTDPCQGVDGECAECPRCRCRIAAAQALDAQQIGGAS